MAALTESPDVDRSPRSGGHFGTFKGVFTPTLLTILGVIMYLRLGWVVGNAGLFGAILIILLAIIITLATGLSLSSIASNTRIGVGGPYAIISRALGIDIGGSIGVPLFLSQTLAVVMYIFGLREAWLAIFPDHSAVLVDLAAFVVVFGIAYISADLAFRVQYVVMGLIAVSLVLIFGALFAPDHAAHTPELWGHYPGAIEDGFSGSSFWAVFAVFFPAATGIMAGANMSGDLRDPRRSIPAGTLAAIAVSTVVYLGLAFWLATAASPAELVSNYTVMVDRSLWAPGVLAGVLGATFSSAVVSLVGAPRILLALADDGLAPEKARLNKVSRRGEPRRALLVSGAIVLVGLLFRDLNAIAPLIAMFFLITYFFLNLVVLIETSLKLTSFRPTLRLNRLVPLTGALGCIFAMFIVNPVFSLVAVGVVVAVFFWIQISGIGRSQDDVRSGIFVAFAEWSAAKVVEKRLTHTRAWKPSLLLPVRRPEVVRGQFRLLVAMSQPEGSIKLLGLATEDTIGDLSPRIERLGRELQENDVFTTWSVIATADYKEGVLVGLQALRSAFFRPNVLVLRFPAEAKAQQELSELLAEAVRLKVGIMLLGIHDLAGLGRRTVINLWVPPHPGQRPTPELLAQDHLNLAILYAYRLARAWRAQLNVVGVVADAQSVEPARAYLDELRDLCRLPGGARSHVFVGSLESAIPQAPQSDVDLMALRHGADLVFVENMIQLTRSSCIFTMDSGRESALA